jgi:ketosteroid isomerase-like protein
MKTPTPTEAVRQLIDAINRADPQTALALYEPGASLVVQPGAVATGTAALREALAGFTALQPTLTTETSAVFESGDLALYLGRWSLSGTDPGGNPVQMGGRSTDVLRRQPDGNWLIVLDNPWGTDLVA